MFALLGEALAGEAAGVAGAAGEAAGAAGAAEASGAAEGGLRGAMRTGGRMLQFNPSSGHSGGNGGSQPQGQSEIHPEQPVSGTGDFRGRV